jgi:hypothetical protein
MRRYFCLLLLLLPFAATGALAASPAKSASSRFDVQRGHVFDLYYLLRKHATAETNPASEIEGLGEAVNATRQLQTDFGGRFSPVWGLLDEYLAKCKNTSEVVRSFARLPETTNFRGKDYPVRANAVRLAQAMHAVEAQFLKTIWPQHRATLQRAAELIDKTLKPKEKECFAYIAKYLKFSAPLKPLPIHLVAEAPYPGGFTYFLRGDERLIVIDVTRNAGTLLLEAVLHEAIHALDGIGSRTQATEMAASGTVLLEARERLRKAGVPVRDVQDAAHLFVFVQAAETVRHVLAPQHKPYGEVAEVYAKLPRVSPVLTQWMKYLDGKTTREGALEQIVQEIAAKTKETPAGNSN